jgi:hypothetical protein
VQHQHSWVGGCVDATGPPCWQAVVQAMAEAQTATTEPPPMLMPLPSPAGVSVEKESKVPVMLYAGQELVRLVQVGGPPTLTPRQGTAHS